jgi:glycosyltransferase involved in cell wall biosynthesis
MNCFNGELYLEEALMSVIKQSYSNWELIFWDNKSTDRSLEIASKYKDSRIKIFKSCDHTNLGKARKNALNNVRGDYLAFLDVDDIWYEGKLANQIKLFDDPNVGITFTNSIFFSLKREKNLYKSKKNLNLNTSQLITNYCLSLQSIIIDFKKLRSLDYSFDDQFSHISDFDLIVRLSSISKIKYLNKVLSGWRIHRNNESFKNNYLFNKEKLEWCNFHLNNNYLSGYRKEIKELKLLTYAEKRILENKISLNELRNFKINSFSNKKNKLFMIFSFIPIIPRIIIFIKSLIFKLRWF